MEEMPAKRATFIAWSLYDCVEGERSVWATTRRQSREVEDQEKQTPPPDRDREQG
jgi:hypothetical protein